MTRYDFFRKRIAPVAFLLVVGLIAYDTCEKQERAQATIVIDLGAAAPRVRSVDAQLIVAGDEIGTFHRAALPGHTIGPCRFKASMPDEAGELRLTIDVDGDLRTIVRRVRAEEGATVRVPVEAELR